MINFVNDLIARYPRLEVSKDLIIKMIETLVDTVKAGGTIYIAGNGGSAADAEHICSELLKGFLNDRPMDSKSQNEFEAFGELGTELAKKLQKGIRAISLLSHPGFTSAFSNDVDASLIYAQQLYALGKAGDIFIGISTSGNAINIKKALVVAKVMGVKSILLTGNKHGVCEEFTDIVVAVDEKETYKIQELHLPIYHTVCMAVESEIFG